MRKICFITGSRADYGLLKTLMKLAEEASHIHFQLIATGSHLSQEFGYTIKKIEQEGFCVDEKVECLISADSNSAMAKSIGLGIISFTDALKRLQPDCIVVLGDRFEIFASVQAAYCLKIPIAHLHGGEITIGALDDGFRHAITKLSHMHFVSHEIYGKRVISLGEDPETVFVSGAPGLDLIHSSNILTKEELATILNFPLKDYFLITLLPATLEKIDSSMVAKNLAEILLYHTDKQLLITFANADAEGRLINETWKQLAYQYPERILLVDSLGKNYFSAIKYCLAVIGNSSSGIIEVPYFEKPTVNLGTRQKGRIFSNSVIQTDYHENSLKSAIDQCLNPEWVFRNVVNCEKHYGSPGKISETIFDVLCKINLDKIVYKNFYES